MLEEIKEQDVFDQPRTTQITAEGLEEESARSLMRSIGGSYSIGPVTIRLAVDVDKPEVKAEIAVLGTKAGTITLSPKKLSNSAGLNLGLAKASVNLSVDFAKTLVRYEIKACVRNILGNWQCTGYKGILFNW